MAGVVCDRWYPLSFQWETTALFFHGIGDWIKYRHLQRIPKLTDSLAGKDVESHLWFNLHSANYQKLTTGEVQEEGNYKTNKKAPANAE